MQSRAIIKWSNIVRYYIYNNRDWGTISIRCWIHKRHSIPRPNGRAMGSLLWRFVKKLKEIDRFWWHHTVLHMAQPWWQLNIDICYCPDMSRQSCTRLWLQKIGSKTYNCFEMGGIYSDTIKFKKRLPVWVNTYGSGHRTAVVLLPGFAINW